MSQLPTQAGQAQTYRAALAWIWIAALALCAAAPAQAEEADNPAVRLFDTGNKPLTEEAITKREGWKLVPEDDVTHTFSGDAVILNDKLAVFLPKAGREATIFSITDKGAKQRAGVGHLGARSSLPDPYGPLKIIENTGGAVMLEAACKRPAAPTLRFRLTAGERILEVRPGGNAHALAAQFRARHVVVPDFFGDDLVFGEGALSAADLPADHFFLALLGGGDAILMCGWQSNRQAADLAPAGYSQGIAGYFTAITCEGDKRIWLAFLEGPGLWHSRTAEADDGWKPPFPGVWRCSRVGETTFADSWDLAEGPSAAQKTEKSKGPTLIYPFDRTRETPLTAFTLVDLMRNTMGKGPCQYVLDQEGLASEENPTPDLAMAWVEKQFQKKAAAKAADEMAERLKGMAEQVRLTEARIGKYAAFARSVRTLCKSEKEVEVAATLLAPADRIEQTLKAHAVGGATPERAGQLATEIVALARKDGSLDECQRLGAQVRAIGVAQDRTLSKCRMATRWLRSQALGRAGGAETAKRVQALADEILWKP